MWRVKRDTLAAAVVLTTGALALWPGRPGRALGVAGGALLMGVAWAGIAAGVNALGAVPAAPDREPDGEPDPGRNGWRGRRPGFVKFFTRHAILAAFAYVMIVRFEFDPVAMLAGATTPAIAVAVEVVRNVRARTIGRHSRIS